MRIEKTADSILKLSWLLIIFFIGVTVFFALQLPGSKIDAEMKNQLPEDLPTRLNLNKIEALFGGTDMAMIIISSDDVITKDTLTRIKKISKEMERIKEFDRVVSLFTAKSIRAEDDEMIVEQAVGRIPKNEEAAGKLRKNLADNELVYGNLVSKDFKHTALIGFLKLDASDDTVVTKLRDLLKKHPGDEESFVGGMPVTRVQLTKDVRTDMSTFLPIGLLVMLVFLFLCFRQVRGVLLPFIMTVMAIIVAMGLAPLLGWKIHTVTVLLPVILLAVANDYGIHILARYQEDNSPGTKWTKKGLAKSGIVELARPVLATGITTMAGLLCLLSHIVIPAEQLGVLAAVGVAFAVSGSLLFIPSILSILPVAKPIATIDPETGKAKTPLDKLLVAAAGVVARKPKQILIAAVVVCTIVGSGTALMVVDTNPMSLYQQDQPMWRSTHTLNEHLGGWAGISVVAEGNIKDPKVLEHIHKLDMHLKKHPKIGTTTSISAVVRKMNQVMNENKPEFNKIPDSTELVAQYFLLYSMSGDPGDLAKLVDFPYENAQLMAKITDSGTSAASDVVQYIKDYLKDNPDAPFSVVGGFLDVLADMVGHIVWGQLMSLGLSILIVGILVGLLMRSAMAALVAMLPLALATALLFGVMGFFGIELNLITAMLSSIMIGVGVDYTIHFLWRYKEERTNGLEPNEAVLKTLTTSGRGIVFNAFSVLVGFAVLVMSAFFPVRFFGLLVLISISACLIGALVVLPAIAIVFKPKFLEPKLNSNAK